MRPPPIHFPGACRQGRWEARTPPPPIHFPGACRHGRSEACTQHAPFHSRRRAGKVHPGPARAAYSFYADELDRSGSTHCYDGGAGRHRARLLEEMSGARRPSSTGSITSIRRVFDDGVPKGENSGAIRRSSPIFGREAMPLGIGMPPCYSDSTSSHRSLLQLTRRLALSVLQTAAGFCSFPGRMGRWAVWNCP